MRFSAMGAPLGRDVAYPYRFTTSSATVIAPQPPATMIDELSEEIRRKLAELRTEHRDLDDVIARMAEDPYVDRLMLQRLKKRKLGLKDQIVRLENQLIPDIIA
jgi:hypothetical protein